MTRAISYPDGYPGGTAGAKDVEVIRISPSFPFGESPNDTNQWAHLHIKQGLHAFESFLRPREHGLNGVGFKFERAQ